MRLHPGERLIQGPSLAAVIHEALPELPAHVHIVGSHETANTYDLMDLADLGLVYTTTVGMEMAMRGVPVVVAGKTHYRGRGFTIDPSSWPEYFRMLDEALTTAGPKRLDDGQVQTAWRYAYRFMFEYPQDFPWRLMHLWKDVREWPVSRVLSLEGDKAFGATFRHLAGERMAW